MNAAATSLALVLVAGAAAQATDTPAPAAAVKNQCVACHELERLPISLGHSYEDWRYSAHARGGVTCERCHGGDASAENVDAAHRGVRPASDPKSLVSAQRIGATCGGCHAEELAAYQRTVHAHQVDMMKPGATCMTCHGAMATSLPSPAELAARCAACHDKPLEAHVSLTMLAATKLRLFRLRREIGALRDADPAWHRNAQERLHELERIYRRIQLEWHTFDSPRLLKDSRDVLTLARLLGEEASKHAEMTARESPPDGTP